MAIQTRWISAAFVIAIISIVLTDLVWTIREPRPDEARMRKAVLLTEQWYNIVARRKKDLGIYRPTGANDYEALLGVEYSELTTTLGSVEAKTAAADPLFGALMVRLLDDAQIDSTKTVGITLSGSFPSLTIATLAAVQAIGAKAVIISSLGASSYGANQPEATWIDQEHWLINEGGLRLHSALVTFGAEGDSGGGISEEGMEILRRAIQRNGASPFVPTSFDDAIRTRMSLFVANRISLFINIGGNQAVLGSCSHSTTIPNGFHRTLLSCMDPERGVLVRLAEKGVPYIQLLNIRDLAVKNGLPLLPGEGGSDSEVYYGTTVRKLPVAISLLAILLLLFAYREKRNMNSEKSV